MMEAIIQGWDYAIGAGELSSAPLFTVRGRDRLRAGRKTIDARLDEAAGRPQAMEEATPKTPKGATGHRLLMLLDKKLRGWRPVISIQEQEDGSITVELNPGTTSAYAERLRMRLGEDGYRATVVDGGLGISVREGPPR